MFEGLQEDQLAGALEALLFVTDEPVGVLVLAQMLEVDATRVDEELHRMAEVFEREGRGIQLREVAGGWRLFTHPAFHELIERYVISWDTRRLSSAALETLAVVAYGQPVTRAQISAIRGVNSESALNTLVERGYVREAGTVDAPGQPVLYATTHTFLEKFGLRSTADLPDLCEFAPDEKTAQLIRERLGAPDPAAADAGADSAQGMPGERDLPSPEQLVADAQAAFFGAVEKIDFDKLVFNTDDE